MVSVGHRPVCGRVNIYQVSPEVIGALLLPKATPRHNADASLFQEAQAEEHVRGQAQLLGVKRSVRSQPGTQAHTLLSAHMALHSPPEHAALLSRAAALEGKSTWRPALGCSGSREPR